MRKIRKKYIAWIEVCLTLTKKKSNFPAILYKILKDSTSILFVIYSFLLFFLIVLSRSYPSDKNFLQLSISLYHITFTCSFNVFAPQQYFPLHFIFENTFFHFKHKINSFSFWTEQFYWNWKTEMFNYNNFKHIINLNKYETNNTNIL